MPSHPGQFRPNLNRRRGGRRAVPTVLQMETTECGAACLAMVLAYYGKWVSLEELRVRCGISRDGSKAINILRAAREYGLIAQGARYAPERLFDLPFPMILFWNFNHFIVLEGIRGDRIWINDPERGPRKVSRREFDESYTGVCLVFQPGEEFQPSGSKPSVLPGLLQRLGHARAPLAYALLASAALILPGLAVPTLVKVFVDDVLIPASETLMTPLLVGLAVAAVSSASLTWLQQMCLARMETKLATIATVSFFAHLVRLPTTFFAQRSSGDITNRVASNDKIARTVSGELATSAVNMLSMLVYGGVMLAYDALLALAAFAMVSLNMVALAWIARRRQEASRRLLKEQSTVAGLSVHGLTTIESLKSDASEARFFARWAGVHANALDARQRLGRLTGVLNAVPPLLSSLTTVLILGLGGLRIVDGTLTIGGLIAFQMLSRRLATPVEGLVLFSANLQVLNADIARIDDVLRHEPLRFDPVEPSPRKAALSKPPSEAVFSLNDITFGYNSREEPIIKDFSLDVAPGRRVALVGRSGSGKTTVAQLACRLLDPWSGSVRIGAQDIARIPSEELSQSIAYVDQNIVLFGGSARDNVTLWNPVITDQMVTQALRDAVILDEINARHGKYETDVGENGLFFSGGQRQLLEIARALAVNPDVLILDEATAALDPLTEMRIDDHLRRRGCACLIVAHRLSTIRDADEIVVMDSGRIVERGTHETLLAENGAYAALMAVG